MNTNKPFYILLINHLIYYSVSVQYWYVISLYHSLLYTIIIGPYNKALSSPVDLAYYSISDRLNTYGVRGSWRQTD